MIKLRLDRERRLQKRSRRKTPFICYYAETKIEAVCTTYKNKPETRDGRERISKRFRLQFRRQLKFIIRSYTVFETIGVFVFRQYV